MKHAIRLLSIVLILVGCIVLIYLSSENRRLAIDINRLEVELGKMPIKDTNQVTIAEIAKPNIPPEVAPHLERVWQFRCYLPPKYDFLRFSGGGRVTPDGLFQQGGHSSSWGSARPIAIHGLLTVSLQKKGSGLEAFYSFNGMSGTTTWSRFHPERFDTLVIQKLVSSSQGPRSFDADAILPLLKIYDPSTAENTKVAGKSLTTCEGGYIILCPKSRETPPEFEPEWIAEAVANE
jgi:hypothetical protein